jgi:hypothetical protein
MTGYRPSPALVYPSLGSVVNRLDDQARPLPSYIAVPDAPPFSSSGFLTPAYDPFAVQGDPSSDRFRVRDLTPPDRVTFQRLSRRRGMVATLDRFAANDVPATPLTASRDRFAQRAFDLLTSTAAQAAFDLAAEPDATRDAYGRSRVGQSCLLARRLVERGVPFVTVSDGTGGCNLGWDTHAGNFATLRDQLAPPLDRALAALLADLDARGLLDRTLVLVLGEFGRTPKINANAGRDHHGRAGSLLVAGGGVQGGRVVGATDRTGDTPTARPVTPADLAATVYTALGIDPEMTLPTADDQPVRLVDRGTAVGELF